MNDQWSGNTLLSAVRAKFADPSRESTQRAMRWVIKPSGDRRGDRSDRPGVAISAPGPRTPGPPGRRSPRWRSGTPRRLLRAGAAAATGWPGRTPAWRGASRRTWTGDTGRAADPIRPG